MLNNGLLPHAKQYLSVKKSVQSILCYVFLSKIMEICTLL